MLRRQFVGEVEGCPFDAEHLGSFPLRDPWTKTPSPSVTTRCWIPDCLIDSENHLVTQEAKTIRSELVRKGLAEVPLKQS